MQRRDSFANIGSAHPSPGATVLYNDRSVALDRVSPDPDGDTGALWIRTRDLRRVNGFELKPQGACRGEVCILTPKDMVRGDAFNLTAFAEKTGQAVVAEPGQRVWSFGEMPALGGGIASSRLAPDFEVPDRLGRPVHLAGFRGRKALVLTWASW